MSNYMDGIAGIIISLGFFTMIILSFYFYFKARHSERMALIEKGEDLSILYQKRNGHLMLKIGMFFMGVAVGLIMALILTRILPIPAVAAYFSMILLFGGFGLIMFYPVSARYFKE